MSSRYLNRFDPQRDTDAFERFREKMQEVDDWEPCDFGCEFEELVGHKLNTNYRLFVVKPCNECVSTYMDDAEEAAAEARAESLYEDHFYGNY